MKILSPGSGRPVSATFQSDIAAVKAAVEVDASFTVKEMSYM